MSFLIDIGTLESGSKTFFWNAAAPVGWVKETNAQLDDAALRLVNGSVTMAGTRGFTEVYDSTLPISENGITYLDGDNLPPHSHGIPTDTGGSLTIDASFQWTSPNFFNQEPGGTDVPTTSSGTRNSGTGQETSGHVHSLSSAEWNGNIGLPAFNINYINIISCSKD